MQTQTQLKAIWLIHQLEERINCINLHKDIFDAIREDYKYFKTLTASDKEMICRTLFDDRYKIMFTHEKLRDNGMGEIVLVDNFDGYCKYEDTYIQWLPEIIDYIMSMES